MTALLEDLRSQFRAVSEAVTAMPEQVERRMSVRFERLEEQVGRLDHAVRQHSHDLRLGSAGIADLRQDLTKLRGEIEARQERARFEALEADAAGSGRGP